MAEQTLTIDGKQYRLADLSDEAKGRIGAVRSCDQRIQQLQQDLSITQTARMVYVNALKEQLPEPVAESGDADSEDSTAAQDA